MPDVSRVEFDAFDDLSDDVQEQWKRDVRTVLAAAVAVDGSGIDGGTQR